MIIDAILNEDSIEGMGRMPSCSMDMVFTDPPYRIITGGGGAGAQSKRPGGILLENKQLMSNIPKFEDWVPEVFRVLKNGGHGYFMVNALNLLPLATCLLEAGFKIHNFLVWKKNNCTPSQFYLKNCEYIIFCRKGPAKYINNLGCKTVQDFDNISGRKCHPTEKPVGLISVYIENSSNAGDTVFDPFMGSGATAQACVDTGRHFVGFEKDPNFYGVALARIGGYLDML